MSDRIGTPATQADLCRNVILREDKRPPVHHLIISCGLSWQLMRHLNIASAGRGAAMSALEENECQKRGDCATFVPCQRTFTQLFMLADVPVLCRSLLEISSPRAPSSYAGNALRPIFPDNN